MITKRRWVWVVALLAAFSLVATACGDDDDTSSDTTVEGSDTTAADSGDGGGDLSGEVVVTGSSTVEPISSRNAEKFNELNPNVAISVDGPGTGDGFEIFCNGEADISDASRAIKEEEAQKCADNGIEFIELKVAIDGLSAITSVDNDAVECLSFGDLYALLGPESTGFGNWTDANDIAAELDGGDWGTSQGPFPDADLSVTAPGEESGTFDSFVELVIEKIAE